MSNPSKQKGTGGENEAIVGKRGWPGLRRWWPKAERRALRGINDAGDVSGTPFVVEVKRAEKWPVHQWLAELEIERIAGGCNGEAAPGFVMCRRNHGKWTFLVPEDVMVELLNAQEWELGPRVG